ncbi:D-arabinose 1-dehydrogenase, Zn-dependent alcohol dehydrogenase family [Asanoa hainanensis]|uniref:D-arabinose 1-dehydrogenase, Zn-dependent alcohol dehydrogenase family n=1 Tax=Asanoa hainanensis TaxID=560556 RepID=A0A239M510_9ACTN|nr:D-arabinose 1-dehydrogenase, Zn-dependent alcohol dehydrogenase family [Asanoa hainanensis]
MGDLLDDYRKVAGGLPTDHRVWRLAGPGLADLEGPVSEPLPVPGRDELLVRHDAVGLSVSDAKIARLGLDHPRVREFPVVPGHEVSLTVAFVGPELRDSYAPGDRFVVQGNMTLGGVPRGYGFDLPGGLAQYAVLGPEMLPFLVPVRSRTGYAEAALAEPWACVEASYAVTYRTTWRAGGTVWLTGDGAGMELGEAAGWHPRRVHLDVRDTTFAGRVRAWAHGAGVEVVVGAPLDAVDDVVVLGPEPERIEDALEALLPHGTCALVTAAPLPRPVRVDVGRLHYDGLALFGTAQSDLATAYAPIRTELLPGGRLWVLGAGGPMGRMHMRRALQRDGRPTSIVATDRSGRAARGFGRIAPDVLSFLSERECGDAETFAKKLNDATGGLGFDDIVVTAPAATAVETAFEHLANGGVINLFAGLPRGTRCAWDLTAVAHRGVRAIGTSGSSVADLCQARDRIESGAVQPNRSVAAIGGLDAAPDALRAVAEGRFGGKVVIFPNLRGSVPLTALTELRGVLPEVGDRLDRIHWTQAAEEELLRGSTSGVRAERPHGGVDAAAPAAAAAQHVGEADRDGAARYRPDDVRPPGRPVGEHQFGPE